MKEKRGISSFFGGTKQTCSQSLEMGMTDVCGVHGVRGQCIGEQRTGVWLQNNSYKPETDTWNTHLSSNGRGSFFLRLQFEHVLCTPGREATTGHTYPTPKGKQNSQLRNGRLGRSRYHTCMCKGDVLLLWWTKGKCVDLPWQSDYGYQDRS